ncbi:hypothetical protein Y032_0002g497 [Ancylostoma ceylanicum]|uniref:Uncharacterized protein n=1 Tax=Ancylostoma ceylanicum TaxID=53326 RepID=A0A016VZR2_9BILA|nr:hypothetical protein Y032_0002g497 [Ancylostoma ceylanicum]
MGVFEEFFWGMLLDFFIEHLQTTSIAGRAPSAFGMAPHSSYGGVSSYGVRSRTGRTALATRNEPARPMTAVRAAGYTSFANKGTRVPSLQKRFRIFHFTLPPNVAH